MNAQQTAATERRVAVDRRSCPACTADIGERCIKRRNSNSMYAVGGKVYFDEYIHPERYSLPPDMR